MNLPPFTLTLLAALVAGSTLFTALPAQAGRDDDHRDRREARGDDRDRHHRSWESLERMVVNKEKVSAKRPVVREYRYYERETPAYYDRSVPVYSNSRAPSLLVGVNVPPLVIPLR